MKELGMSWREIKGTPRHEMTGLLVALNSYNRLHQFDGYTSDDIAGMAKDKPQIRSEYAAYLNLQREYDLRLGKKTEVVSFAKLLGK
jgi:hypothetical protein